MTTLLQLGVYTFPNANIEDERKMVSHIRWFTKTRTMKELRLMVNVPGSHQ